LSPVVIHTSTAAQGCAAMVAMTKTPIGNEQQRNIDFILGIAG
jgi:hypothetical protein